MATSYSWELIAVPVTGSPPDPGSYVPSAPMFGGAAQGRPSQFERGIKFANVPLGRADNVVHGGPRVWHVNSLQTILQLPIDRDRSGAILNFRSDGDVSRVYSIKCNNQVVASSSLTSGGDQGGDLNERRLSQRNLLTSMLSSSSPPSWTQAHTGLNQAYIIREVGSSFGRSTNTFMSASSVIP